MPLAQPETRPRAPGEHVPEAPFTEGVAVRQASALTFRVRSIPAGSFLADGRGAVSTRPQHRGFARAVAVCWVASALVFAVGCGKPRGGDGAPPKDVVVVVLDALRADALGCYGAARPTSPAIDTFARAAWVAQDVHASASYTLASVASIFTGTAPGEHRVLGLASNVLPPDVATLAARFSQTGFAAAGFSSNPHVTAEGGFARGFSHFEYLPRDRFDLHSVPAAFLPAVLEWWDLNAAHRRFLYIHVLPPHQPYDPPEPFGSLFGTEGMPREEGLTDWLTKLQRSGGARNDPALLARLRARYDANVAYADAWFGELVDALDARGARDNALVVLTSDHGEGFGEHGDVLHGSNAFAEMTHVPLIARVPGTAPRRAAGLVGLADLAATLCDFVDIGWPGGGRSFRREFAAGRFDDSREALSRSMGSRPLWALRTGDWTFVRQTAGGFEALYDRAQDPLELNDVASDNAPRAQTLAARLTDRLHADQTAAANRARPRAHRGDQAALEALGYTGDAGLLEESPADKSDAERLEPDLDERDTATPATKDASAPAHGDRR